MLIRILLALLFSGLLGAAAEPEAAFTPPQPPLGFGPIPSPRGNPLTPEKVALGKRLFSDPLLSADGTVACATCHRLDYSFTVPERFGRGLGGKLTARRPPTLLNRAYGTLQFWDGRVASLEDLALLPIQQPDEMGLSLPELERRLRSHPEYSRAFLRVFGQEPSASDVARAMAAYLRTLLSGASALDQAMSGEGQALPPAVERGYALFQGKARCNTCHWEPNYTDEEFHNTGVAARQPVFDRGRGGGAFKVPTLRDVSRRPPYMHDGSLATLEEVIEFYNGGGQPNPRLDNAIRPLDLTPEEKADLLAFLKSL